MDDNPSNAAAGGGMSMEPDEMDPMMDGEKKMDKSSSESDPQNDSSFKSSSSFDSSLTNISYDEEKFIWDQSELDNINKRRKISDKVPVVKRDKESTFGIRANTNMTWGKCWYSLILPWHNEWINIWLYVGFALYFWIQIGFILGKYKLYKLNNDLDWLLMFVATLGIAISLTASAIYLTFYSISEKLKMQLYSFNFQGIILMIYCFYFVLIATEWAARQPTGFYFLLFTALFLLASLVLIQYPDLAIWTLWFAIGWGVLLILIDLGFANTRQLKIFYLPVLVESLILGIGILCLVFRVPERWFKNTKFVNLYLNSSVIYTIFLINFLFELHNILYYTIKANSNTLEDDDEWWRTKNIYNEN